MQTSPLSDLLYDSSSTIGRRSKSRTTAILRLALLQCDRGIQLCRVTNVSSDGLQATIFGTAPKTEFISISMPDDITVEGTIVWSNKRAIGVEFFLPLSDGALLRISTEKDAGRRRRLPRIRVNANARLRTPHRSYSGELLDISTSGAMFKTAGKIPSREPTKVHIDGLPAIDAQVRWIEGERAGVLFNSPLQPAHITDWLQSQNSARG